MTTKNSYTLAVVHEDERSAAGGVTNIVRSLGAGLAPSIAGVLYEDPATRCARVGGLVFERVRWIGRGRWGLTVGGRVDFDF